MVSRSYPKEMINAIIAPPEVPINVSAISSILLFPRYLRNPR